MKSGKIKKRFHKRIKSIVLKDLQLGKVERVDNILFPMVQDKIVLIPYFDFVIS